MSTEQLLLDLDRSFKRYLAIKGNYRRPIESNFLVQAMWVHDKCKAAATRDSDRNELEGWTNVFSALQLTTWPYVNFTGDLVNLVATADRYLMLQTLFQVRVFTGIKNGKKSDITLRAPVTFLKRYVRRARYTSSKPYIDNIVRAFGTRANASTAETLSKLVYELEMLLEHLSLLAKDPGPVVIKSIQSVGMLPKHERWDWLRYMRLLLKADTPGISEDTLVLVEDPQFFAGFHTLLGTEERKTTIANYVGLKVVVTLSPFRPFDYGYLYDFIHDYNVPNVERQLVACSVLLEKMFRYGVGITAKLTLSKEFANIYRTHFDERFALLFNETRMIITDLLRSRHSWFSDPDAKRAHRKLDNMTLVFGTQRSFIHYESYRQTPTLALESKRSIIETVFSIFSYASSIYWDAQGGGHHAQDSYDNAYSASIFDWASEYQPSKNHVFIPNAVVGFLSHISNKIPFLLYPVILPHVVRGVLQSLVRSNSLFDERMLPEQWWGSGTVGEYENITQCLRRQYETRLTAAERGNATPLTASRLEADFLDNAVLWPVYHLYQEALRSNNATELFYKSPGSSVTSTQLFFYNYAAAFCDGADDGARQLQLGLGVTPAKIRLNIPLMNFPPFGKVFSCRQKDTRDQWCEVWKGLD